VQIAEAVSLIVFTLATGDAAFEQGTLEGVSLLTTHLTTLHLSAVHLSAVHLSAVHPLILIHDLDLAVQNFKDSSSFFFRNGQTWK
jgi:hypothetical protein